MLTRRSLVLAAAAIALFAGAAFVLRGYVKSLTREFATKAVDEGAADPDLDRARDKEAIERLGGQVSQLRRELQRVEEASVEAQQAQAAEADAPPAPSRPPQPPTREERARPFVEKLRSEAFDPAWARPTEQQIHDTMRDETLRDSRLQSVKCGSTVCEVTVTHSNADAQASFADQFWQLGPQTQEAMCQPRDDENAQYSTVCYLSRPGQPVTFAMPAGRRPSP